MATDPREPGTWDGWLTKGGARETRIRHNLVFSQLFQLAPEPNAPCQLVFRPELAESWKWVNDRLLEVQLRQGVKFQNRPPVNGREMTADDVVWSANKFVKEDPALHMEVYGPHVTKIEAAGRYTVRFQLDTPMPAFLTEGFTIEFGTLVLPPEVVDSKGRWEDPNKSYIGTGPFTFKQHVPGVRSSFVKHKDYFKKGMPYLDGIDYVIVPELSTQIASLRSGALDMVYGPVPAPMALSLKSPAFTTVACPQIGSVSGRFGFRIDLPPFNDVRVRRAFQIAYDREAMVKSILLGQGVTAPHYSNQVSNAYLTWEELPPEVAQWVKYDPKRAKQLLAEAGHPNGLDISLKLSTGYRTPYPEIAEAMMAFLKEAGFKVKPHLVVANEWASFTNTGDFADDQVAFGMIGPQHSPVGQLSQWQSRSPVNSNRSRINDPELDKMMDQLLVEADQNKFIQLYKKMEGRLIEQAYEPTSGVFPLQFTVMQSYVKGFYGEYQYLATTYGERLWMDK